jgi:hypothetical protein
MEANLLSVYFLVVLTGVQQVVRDDKGTSFHLLISVGTNLKGHMSRNVIWADLVRFMSGLGRGMIGPLNKLRTQIPHQV